MVQSFSLKAQSREIIKKQVKNLRNSGLVPSVVYGKGEKPINISADAKEFRKVFSEAGTSSLIDLKIGDDKSFKVIINDIQEHPVTGNVVHIDFYKVKMDEEIRTEIPLEFTGESSAVKDLDGSLVTNRDNIEVECLPSALVSEIQVDISKLASFEDQITVADLNIPEGIKVLTEPEEVIALVEEPRSEEELAELEESTAEQEKEAVEQAAGEEPKEGEESESEGGDDKEDK
ncbi:MAG: 50S ribosomal protein L25 [candidate division WS2 bacterium ADurb.Bin280]|uniref:Large ribosomal subunit protein bL25 n=1 Tax=candidate division WS2 bacterium ADurb.Bin280 TaxID=1852829 RepID=A0A1V5SFL3_9BACT|nr:MAG: 50S ribosomal protein L25 [candidate division WS2 bacterium ADurb.Bin280]